MANPILQSLSDADLARLHVKFELPLTVSRMLNGEEMFDEVSEYALHTALETMTPSRALMAMALCAQNISGHTGGTPAGLALRYEADRIVDEYGPQWLNQSLGSAALDSRLRGENSEHVMEDLESLCHHLYAAHNEVGENFPVTSTICEIMGSEALMHIENTEPDEAPEMEAEATISNVVRFPGAPRFSL